MKQFLYSLLLVGFLLTVTLPAQIALFGVSFANAQPSAAQPVSQAVGAPSLSGDDLCGGLVKTSDGRVVNGKPCTVTDFKNLIKITVYNFILPIFILFLVVYSSIVIGQAYLSTVQGDATALTKVKGKLTNGVLGLLIIVGSVGGILIALLKLLGIEEQFLKLISDALFTTAYAQGSGLQNTVQSTSLYDFLLVVVRAFIRYFVYPGIIFAWVFTGFSFVMAQGNPEKLTKAKLWLLWAVGCTIAIFITEAFLFSLRNTINSILPGAVTNTSQQQSQVGTPDGRIAPAEGAVNSACRLPDGTTGVMATDGCRSSARGPTTSPGDACLTAAGRNGVVDNDYVCQAAGGR